LASENEIVQLFEDCSPGAIPPIGECYGPDAVVKPSICDQPDVYFVGGDHANSRVRAEAFDGRGARRS
jgi:Ala-tRNA(Pro) deacylase